MNESAPDPSRFSKSLQNDRRFQALINKAMKGGEAQVDGVWGSAIGLVVQSLRAKLNDRTPVLVVCSKIKQVDGLVDDINFFAPDTAVEFPLLDQRPNRVLQDESYGDRLRILKQLASNQSLAHPVVVAPLQSLMHPVPDRATVQRMSRRIALGDKLEADDLARWLVENRYHATSAVELPGEFSLRGGILDLFATDWETPVRVELFGDEVESIRSFDIATQRSLESLQELELTVLSETQESSGIVFEYLTSNSVVVLIEPADIQDQGQQIEQRHDDDTIHHGVHELLRGFSRMGRLVLTQLATDQDEDAYRLPIESVERFSGEIGRVRRELDQIAVGQDVYLVSETEAEIQRLKEILDTTETAKSGRLHYWLGRLQSGFRLLGSKQLLVSGNEMFHRAPLRRTSRRKLGRAIESFLDLREGDLVVHLGHGIGRYRGLELLKKGDHVEEHLKLEFHGGTMLYVPSTKIDLVQKYIGAKKIAPRLATIGGKSWQRQKQAAARAVQDLANDLLEVQAARNSSPGIRFGRDSEWQREFDASFPYTETADQLLAIEAIKSDMEAAKPMDRLICGDVGFGKTEVAMRAAFKAVDSGYQVAVLVPTTILAEQHFRSFSERMAEFPFSIGKLSRFCSNQEQRETVAGLKAGEVDIVIGTHRLASKDVKFQNLGLLIIDEEQRFGVEVKERLKTMRASIDVLTLSATPIPRTLHMSLTGIRDISNLETPPEDRVAVETRVTRWSNTLIRNAVTRELDRGGQIYFVHNRVGDIENVKQKLQFIVPEAEISIGHGQMPEGELEKVMVRFVNGSFDMLLATTIVESGLDIPNANTIFIDEAHRYGLADLHQLRGRVGRYKNLAYCYLLVDPKRSLTPDAARRLRAIEEFSEMGAGFSIAMRDLEIRGAGNILGTQQSGHIALVGYELYCQLLEAAVRRLQKLPPQINTEIDIELPGEAYIPREYVPDMRTKVDLYRRLSRSFGPDAIAQMKAEFQDRFGPLPTPVRRMLQLAQLRTEAAVWQVDAIAVETPYLVFRYTDVSRARQLVNECELPLRRVDDRSIYLPLPADDLSPEELLELAMSVLRRASESTR